MFISGRNLSAFPRLVLYSKAASLARWRYFCNDEEVYWCEKLHVKLWIQALEVMVHFIFPVISCISLLASFHSLNRMPLVSEMVHTRGLSFAAQRKIDQLPNRTIDQSTKPLLDVIILYGGSWKTRIAVTKEFIKTTSKTRSNFHPVLKLNYF